MKPLYLLVITLFLLSCKTRGKQVDEKIVATNLHSQDTTTKARDENFNKRCTILVLPPYDKIANAGISPPVHEYLESSLSKDSTISLTRFPFNDLMTIPYHNVFDKKYCKPILDKVSAEVLVMSMLEQSTSTGNMTRDTWDLSLKIYYPKTDRQIDSKTRFNALTDEQLKESISWRTKELLSEIQMNR